MSRSRSHSVLLAMSFVLSLVLSGFASSYALGQTTALKGQGDKADYWYGTLDLGTRQLRLLFRITGKGDKRQGTIKSLDQARQDIKLDSVKFDIENSKLQIECARIKLVYKGKLDKTGKLCTGTYTQSGKDFPLSLQRFARFRDDAVAAYDGTLKAGKRSLRFRIRIINEPNGKQIARLDSPDESLANLYIKLEETKTELNFTVPLSRAKYVGKKSADGKTIEGKWKQGFVSLPLTFTRVPKDKLAKPITARRPQTPKGPFPYRAIDVSFDNTTDKVRLHGTLTLPKGKEKAPAVVMVTGSGPQDRDETIAGHKPFLVIADYLTRRGIAVLRYDDRGIAKSTGSFADGTSESFARDALAAVRFLQSREDIQSGKIGVVGHSEGAMIASRLAARHSDIAFIVLMGGPGVSGERIILTQSTLIAKRSGGSKTVLAAQETMLKAILGAISKQADADTYTKTLTTAVNEFVKVTAPSDAVAEASRKALTARMSQFNTPWFRYFLAFDPSKDLEKVQCPTLALIGELDLQVPAEENSAATKTALTKAKNKDFEVHVLPRLNHLFQRATTGLPNEYGQIQQTIDPSVLDRMHKWIEKRAN